MGSAASVTAYLQVPAKRTVGVVRMTVGGMRIGVGGVRMAAGGMRIGVGACEWLSEDANRCRCVRKAVDFEKRVVSVLRANQCWLGMRISVGTNANTHMGNCFVCLSLPFGHGGRKLRTDRFRE